MQIYIAHILSIYHDIQLLTMQYIHSWDYLNVRSEDIYIAAVTLTTMFFLKNYVSMSTNLKSLWNGSEWAWEGLLPLRTSVIEMLCSPTPTQRWKAIWSMVLDHRPWPLCVRCIHLLSLPSNLLSHVLFLPLSLYLSSLFNSSSPCDNLIREKRRVIEVICVIWVDWLCTVKCDSFYLASFTA